jgi:glycosyltransferase involved in cell wall biosynthesis
MLDDVFIVGVVGRNQPRKRLDLTMAYFANWIKNNKIENAYLFLHVAPTGEQGYDLGQLAHYFGIAHRVIISEPDMGMGVEEEALVDVYNSFDIMLTTTQGEGWGLTHMEAMACGIPCVVPDWSALGEWPEDAAVKIPCTTFACTPNGINVIGGIPDEDSTVEALNGLYRDKDYRLELSLRGQEVVSKSQYRWENIGKQFAMEVEKAVGPRLLTEVRALEVETA